MLPYVFLFEICLAKMSFWNLISIKSYRGKTFGGSVRPLDQEGLFKTYVRCDSQETSLGFKWAIDQVLA